MKGTSPLFGSGTSKSSAPTSSLVSKLQQRLPSITGSTICSMRWKWKATPRGRWYCQLVASAHRTSDSAFFSSVTWPTPTATDHKSRKVYNGGGLALDGAANLAVWATPTANEGTGPQRAATKQGGASLREQVANLAVWPTPQTDSFRSRGGDRKHEMGLDQLARSIPKMGPARITVDGQILTGSSAGMKSGGQLNPAHSRWLMGFPAAWDDCAPTATPLSRKSRLK